jgi:phosphoribosyl 1,2-cyclic phosphodiesterase
MRVKFWGARGSTPTPERRNARYGGNTACIEVRLADDTLIILDSGSGLRGLGRSLVGEYGDRPIQAYIFLTHFHWDHIQGIPFFLPLYKRGNTFLFHAVMQQGKELQATIEGQMANPYFPVNMNVMGAARHFFELEAHPININGAVLSSAPLNHPQGCVGYRIEADGEIFVLATDTEPGSAFHDRSVRELAQGADVFVYDAQYTPEQVAGEKKGWGHSSWAEGARIAQECRVKQLLLFHHDPDSDDAYIDGLVGKARREFPCTHAAAEGLELDLSTGEVLSWGSAQGADRRTERRYRLEMPLRVEWREPTGEVKKTQGLAQDISSSGISFLAPQEFQADRPFEVELVLPDEITHRGDVGIRFSALPVRRGRRNESVTTEELEVGARLNPAKKSPSAQPARSKKTKK